MFSFFAGVTLSKYIRRRQLTLAVFESKQRPVAQSLFQDGLPVINKRGKRNEL
jgi:hypothetical protein